jgi:hypothetical protein
MSWQFVESAPVNDDENRAYVLITRWPYTGNIMPLLKAYKTAKGEWRLSAKKSVPWAPTHWMPVPDPPTQPHPNPSKLSEFPCHYCGVKTVRRKKCPESRTYDHIVPKSKGGKDTVVCCNRCNGLKGKMSEDEYRALIDQHGFVGSALWLACIKWHSAHDKAMHRKRLEEREARAAQT